MNFILSNFSLATKATVLTTLLAVASLASATASATSVRMNTTGGGSCKGSSGFGAQYFYFANTYAQNTTSSSQYLTCEVPFLNNNTTAQPGDIQVVFLNPTGAAITVTCALQSGYDVVPGSIHTSIYNINIAANDLSALYATSSSAPPLPVAVSQYDPFTISCLMPPQSKLGVITTGVTTSP